ncbi:MAG: hypothetical protein AB1589_22240 [Cyanobacteriota bacterium]
MLLLILGTLGGNDSSASDINDKGVIVGSSQTSSGTTHAVKWENGAIADLDALGDNYSYATAINNMGTIIGYSSQGGVFVWKNGTLSDLNSLIPANLGWKLNAATDINDLGQIVGYGNFNGHVREAFLLTPITIIQ